MLAINIRTKSPVVDLWLPSNGQQSTGIMQAIFCCCGCHKRYYIKNILNSESSVTTHSPMS